MGIPHPNETHVRDYRGRLVDRSINFTACHLAASQLLPFSAICHFTPTRRSCAEMRRVGWKCGHVNPKRRKWRTWENIHGIDTMGEMRLSGAFRTIYHLYSLTILAYSGIIFASYLTWAYRKMRAPTLNGAPRMGIRETSAATQTGWIQDQ